MSKIPLPEDQKVFEAGAIETRPDKLVEQASKWAKALWERAYRGMGDTQEAAMYRAAQKHGIEPSTFWSLKYRPPKDMPVSVFARLMAAYQAECGRQEAKLRHEIEIAKALPATASRLALIAEAEAALGIEGSADGAGGSTEADADFDQRQGWGNR